MDHSSTSNSSMRACTAAGSSDAMLARDAPVHPVRNLMRRGRQWHESSLAFLGGRVGFVFLATDTFT
eukprot:scaffold137807_cov49-Attheya_sp.AAC.1